jgi:hypothetical protein
MHARAPRADAGTAPRTANGDVGRRSGERAPESRARPGTGAGFDAPCTESSKLDGVQGSQKPAHVVVGEAHRQ